MRRIVLIAMVMTIMSFSNSYSQKVFSEVWINGGFGLSLAEMYSINILGEEQWEGIEGDKSYEGVFGLLIGGGIKLFEINENTYFAPSIYYHHLVPGKTILYYYDYDSGTDTYSEYTYETDNTLKDLSINGDFYFKIPKRERTLFLGIGVGVHNVTFKQEFSFEPKITGEVPGLPGIYYNDENDNNKLIDESETKVGINLIAKVKLVQDLFLEGRFEITPGFPQFRLSASYPLWKRKHFSNVKNL